jgi:DNA-binding response OmpR family regulator
MHWLSPSPRSKKQKAGSWSSVRPPKSWSLAPAMTTRVLVVDDSPTIRKVVTGVLERHGFEVMQAGDGQEAIDILSEAARGEDRNGATKIDLVLVDFVMPKMNGFQLCRALRQDERLRATPVVLMSAKSDRIGAHFVQQTGAIDAIAKPFDSRALVAVIENAMRRSERWRARGAAAGDIPDGLDGLDGLESSESTSDIGALHAALAGDMNIIPIGAALQLLQVEGKTGVLVVGDGSMEVTISLRDGLIDLVQARGAGREFRLGRYFVERGLVTDEDIDRMLRRSPPPHSSQEKAARKLLGALLVDSGRVTGEQLRDALARQSSELVYEVLRWPRGRFEFRREPPPPLAESARLGLPVASVVMEGFRRVDEWRLVESGLGSFESVLLEDPGAVESIDVDRLAMAEQRLLRMIDGERTVREIIEESHMSSFDACKILFQLLESRLVRRRSA